MVQGQLKTIRAYEGDRALPSKSESLIDFIYEASTTKSVNWNIGDHVQLGDGREFVYSKSSAACLTGQGCEFTAAGVNAYTVFAVAQGIGDREITIPASTHDAFTLDELRGGFVCIHDGVTSNQVQFRGIIGNDVTAADVAFKVYLDGKLTEAVVIGTSAVESWQNPYAALRTGTMNYNPKAGVPAGKVTAANMYFWCQIRKFCWAAPQGGKLGTSEGGYCGGLWSDYGNISDFATSIGVTVANGRGSQYAGHSVLGDADNIGPLFNLQN